MTRSPVRCALLAVVLLTAPRAASSQSQAPAPAPAPAQVETPESQPPGPYVIDLRGTTVGVPNDLAFFPGLAEGTSVPARAFGFDAGLHVYPLSLGPSRIGVGASVLYARAHLASSGVTSTVKTISPQISFNFGARQGWSYLSAGYGAASIRTEAPLVTSTTPDPVTGAATVSGGVKDTGRLGAVNVGGGARWFLSDHLAVAFDVRFHRLAASPTTPRVTLVSASVGLSVR